MVSALAAMAHPLRLRVFRALVVAGPAGLTPGVLAQRMEVPSSSLSFHLKELAGAGSASQERDSRHLVYRARIDRMAGLLSFLSANCCQGQAGDLPAVFSCAPEASALATNLPHPRPLPRRSPHD